MTRVNLRIVGDHVGLAERPAIDGDWGAENSPTTICAFGRLAQLARALPSHGRGRWFESSIAHHTRTPPAQAHCGAQVVTLS